ncbi:DUF648 domain-containing protein [Chlamydia sp. 17-3921]|uniref:DUF648 domain-containing protein n=1 Tax=Chlamydia sp. 17-3921 TaxID=2675798 RepID=UPI00191AD854|nr:DUF648 domain-containing protein [Chlamydia sp. 17-3921]
MQIYSFSSEYSLSFFQERLLSHVSSYLNLRGEKTIFLSRTRGYDFCIQKESHISTLKKVLKILSFIFFPIVLIALALYYFLHNRFQQTHRIISLDQNVSPEDKVFIIANPQQVTRAARDAKAPFFVIPSKYRTVTVSTVNECKTLIFGINLEKISQSIDVSHIDIETRRLFFQMDHSSDSIHQLIEKLKRTEKGEHISENGKRKLLDLFLEFLFVSGVNQTTNLPQTMIPYYLTNKGAPTLWLELLTERNLLEEDSGFIPEVLYQLQCLGLIPKGGEGSQLKLPNPNFMSRGVYVYWSSDT